jgi:hypothetical protein
MLEPCSPTVVHSASDELILPVIQLRQITHPILLFAARLQEQPQGDQEATEHK